MNLKEKWQKRIEKNAFKSDLSWTDSSGKVHMEKVYFKRSKMPLVGDWTRIYPPLNEDGKINWTNLIFGGKQNFFKLLGVFIIVALIFMGFAELFGYINLLESNPCFETCINNAITTIG